MKTEKSVLDDLYADVAQALTRREPWTYKELAKRVGLGAGLTRDLVKQLESYNIVKVVKIAGRARVITCGCWDSYAPNEQECWVKGAVTETL